MNKKQLIVAWRQVLKFLISPDYYLGFLPTLVVFYVSKLFSTPKDNIEFYKRTLHIQAIICPLTYALFLMILWYYFNVHLAILYIILVVYGLSVAKVHYTKDQYVYLVTDNKIEEAGRLSKRLKKIKLISFYCFIFILALLFPK